MYFNYLLLIVIISFLTCFVSNPLDGWGAEVSVTCYLTYRYTSTTAFWDN